MYLSSSYSLSGAVLNVLVLIHFICTIIFKGLFIYFEGERERERGRDRGERISSRLCTVSTEPISELDLTNHEIMA